MLGFIPFVLGGGAFAGYLLGSFVEEKLNAPHFAVLACIGISILASIFECVRIVKIDSKEG
jgi:hypothetical protein